MSKTTSEIWRPGTEEPEGEVLLMTKDGRFRVGAYDGTYYWFDGQYHLKDEVAIWASLNEIQEATKWLECLESYGLTK